MEVKELENAIVLARMDASNVKLDYDDEIFVNQTLKRASEHLASARSDPGKQEEHIRSGFGDVGKVRGVLGNSPVQSQSFRRHQWPFLPPGTDQK
jgi:hypothetical protein